MEILTTNDKIVAVGLESCIDVEFELTKEEMSAKTKEFWKERRCQDEKLRVILFLA